LWRHKGALSISLGVTAVALLIYVFTFIGERPTPAFDFIYRTELASLDLRFQWRGKTHPDQRIVIVDIDQRSQEVLGRWPFPRSNFAKMLDALREDGARVVGFDITFSKPDEVARPVRELRSRIEEQRKRGRSVPPWMFEELAQIEKEFDYDRQFADAVQRFGKVVLGNFFLYTEADLRGPLAIIMGSEQYGLGEFWLKESDLLVRIPMAGQISSLNVSVAAGIVLFDWKRKKGSA